MPALTPIAQPPHAISQEEHDALTSSTPANFDDIPPVLRWQGEAEVSLAVPSWTAWASARAPNANADGGVDGEANGDSEGGAGEMEHKVRGQLYVTEQAVAFIPVSQQGFALPFPALTLHALTPAGGFLPAHIYCQIDEGDATDEDEYTAMAEMRIFVEETQLTPLFDALSACSALHASLMPSGEPSSFFGFEDDDDEWDEDAEDGAFDDADEEHHGGGRALQTVTEADDEEKAVEVSADGDDDGDVEDDVEDDDDDAISRFLAKVDWRGVQAEGTWVDVGASKDEDAGLRIQLDAANARIAELEAKLRAAGLE